MFVIFLKFSDNSNRAKDFMSGHMAWLKRGFDEGMFLVAGSLQPDLGGGIIARNLVLPDLEAFVEEDPFVAENVVKAEIHQITPSRVDERVKFLLD